MDILKNLGLETSLLVSNLGSKKENIYRNEIFADCITDRDKKTARRKIRTITESYVKTILLCKDSAKLKKLCADFYKYYCAIYRTNDFSLASICSNNTDEVKKENYSKFLAIVQKNIVSGKTEKTEKKKETKKKQAKETTNKVSEIAVENESK